MKQKVNLISFALLIEQLKSDIYLTVELANVINIFLVLGYPLDVINSKTTKQNTHLIC